MANLSTSNPSISVVSLDHALAEKEFKNHLARQALQQLDKAQRKVNTLLHHCSSVNIARASVLLSSTITSLELELSD
jgi:hypothetical protein